MIVLYLLMSFAVGGFVGYIFGFPKKHPYPSIQHGGSPHHHLVRTRVVDDDWGRACMWVATCSCGLTGARCQSEEKAVNLQQKHAELFRKANEIEEAPHKPAVEAEPPQYIF